jgi:hypothetical protein
MRSRSVLVVLSLLAFTAGPVDAAKKGQKGPKKVTAGKQVGGKKKVAPDKKSGNKLGATRNGGGDKETPGLVAASSAPIQRSRPVRRTPTRTVHTTHQAPHQAPAVGVAPAPAAGTMPAFDTTRGATVRPRRTGRVKKFFTGLAVVVALAAGGFGWHAADMNTKVGNAYEYVVDQVGGIFDGAGGGGGGGGEQIPGPQDPGPIPIPDPGPLPDPGPGDPGDPEQQPGPQNPGPQDPSPSGGHGKQTPKGPETK